MVRQQRCTRRIIVHQFLLQPLLGEGGEGGGDVTIGCGQCCVLIMLSAQAGRAGSAHDGPRHAKCDGSACVQCACVHLQKGPSADGMCATQRLSKHSGNSLPLSMLAMMPVFWQAANTSPTSRSGSLKDCRHSSMDRVSGCAPVDGERNCQLNKSEAGGSGTTEPSIRHHACNHTVWCSTAQLSWCQRTAWMQDKRAVSSCAFWFSSLILGEETSPDCITTKRFAPQA